MNEVVEFQRIANEEDGSVVADHIPIAFLGVELERKAARIALGIGRPLFAADRGAADECRRLLSGLVEELGGGVFRHVGIGAGEMAIGTGALRVYNAFRHALAIEVSHFFKQQIVFENYRATRPNSKRVLVVSHRTSGSGGELFLFVWHGPRSLE